MIRSKALRFLVLLLLGLAFVACSSDGGDDMAEGEQGTPDEAGMQTQENVQPQEQVDEEMALAIADAQRRTAIVNDLIAKAEAAANAGDHLKAHEYYRQALDYDPTNRRASTGYDAMTKLLMDERPKTDKFNAVVAKQQEIQVKAAHYYREGIKARAENRLADAVDNLDRAYQLLKYNESPLATDLNADFVKKVLDDTRELKDRHDRMAAQREQEQIARMKREEEERERLQLQRRKRALWENLLDKFEAEEYDRVERIADAILKLDYKDVDAARIKEAARQARRAIARERNVSDLREEWVTTFMDIKSKMVPETGIIGFPSEEKWKEISARGPIQLSRAAVEDISDADRAVRDALANTVLPKVDWSAKTFAEVIDELTSQTNVNIFATPEARTAGEDAGELGLEFTQIAAEDALAALCGRTELVFTTEGGLVKIQTKAEASKNKVVEFYNVRDLVNGIRNFPGVQLNLNASGVGGGEEALEEEDTEPTRTLEMEGLINLLKTVDPGWDDDENNRIDPMNETGVLIVKQTPAYHRLIRRVLEDLRRNTGVQVAIEARFITVENNFLQEIGVDLRGLGDDTAGVGVAGPGTNRSFDDFGQAGNGFGSPSAPLGIGTGNDSGVFFSDRNGNTDVRGRVENLFDESLGNPATLDSSGGTSFQFAYLDDVQLEAILRAVQKYERTNTVTAPRLLMHNTQRAHLMVLNEVSYVKDFDVEIAQASTIADPVIDKIREGVILDVRPIVSHDRRYITLELRPTVATLIKPIRTFTTQLGVGAAVTFQLPELQKQAVNTTVVIPDGGTLLLAGMKFAEEKTLDSGVPILRDIPVVGFFFSRDGKATSMKDLIILLKVEIVIGSELEPNPEDETELLR